MVAVVAADLEKKQNTLVLVSKGARPRFSKGFRRFNNVPKGTQGSATGHEI